MPLVDLRHLALTTVDNGVEQPPDAPRGRRWSIRRRRGIGPPAKDERLWIHPSELPSFDSVPVFDPASIRRNHSVYVAVAGVAVLALASVTLALRSSTPTVTAALTSNIAATVADLPTYVQAAANSTIELVVTSEGHVDSTAAMVIEPGNLAVTTDPIPANASITGSSLIHHRFPASLVSFDRALGFSVIRLGVTLPVTPTGVLPASATVLAIAPYFSNNAAAPEFAWATTTLGDPVREQSNGIVSYLATASSPNLEGSSDSLAVDGSGHVVAVLSARGQWFSAQYITKVAQVVTHNGGCHGRLGIAGVSAEGGGVEVTTVEPGPSRGKLHRGDILLALNGTPLDSMDTLLSYLYASPTREKIRVQLIRHGTEHTVSVILGCQP